MGLFDATSGVQYDPTKPSPYHPLNESHMEGRVPFIESSTG